MQIDFIILLLLALILFFMKIYYDNTSLQEALFSFLKKNERIGFVPTMGALHEGHQTLIETASNNNTCVVVSVFVNPTQFNNPQDLEKYPRTLEKDVELLKKVSGNIIIYSPNASELYGDTILAKEYNFGGIENEMEGKHRAGHFNGVGTVLNLLFRVVQPTNAYFGEKDFQQLQIVKKLVEIEKLPITVIGCPIVREKSGLAMSSRNKRLSQEQLKEAALIYKTLTEVKENFNDLSILDLNKLVANKFSNNALFKLEYFEITDSKTLKTAYKKRDTLKYRGFIAAFIGEVRLIDNIALN